MELFITLWNPSVNHDQSLWIDQLSPFVDKCAEALQRSSLTEVATTLEIFLRSDTTNDDDHQEDLHQSFSDQVVLERVYNYVPSAENLSWENRYELMENWMTILRSAFMTLKDGRQYKKLSTTLVMVQLYLRLALLQDLSRFALVKEMQMQSITYVLHVIMNSRRHENLMLLKKYSFQNPMWRFLVPSALFFGYLWYRNSG